jgi:hypothetical protein
MGGPVEFFAGAQKKVCISFDGKQRVPFLRFFYPPFWGGGFSLIVVGELKASEYSLGGPARREDS